jgi:predicted aconitase with swiveling domain
VLSTRLASVAINIMRAHPLVIVGSVVQENPVFVPPDEFLRELHATVGPRA